MFFWGFPFIFCIGVASFGCNKDSLEVSFDKKNKNTKEEDTATTESFPPDNLPLPNIDVEYEYADLGLPDHFSDPESPYGVVITSDNTPEDNMITNAGAILGRVLFYDRRLSQNNTTSCASCHFQENGFGDPRQFSVGLYGDLTPRHSMPLVNVRYYLTGHMFFSDISNLNT